MDVVDLLLLMPKWNHTGCGRTSKERSHIASPPESCWERFIELARRCGRDIEMNSALQSVNLYLRDAHV